MPVIYQSEGWMPKEDKRYKVEWWNRGQKRDATGAIYFYNTRWLALLIARIFALFGRAVEVDDARSSG